MKNTIFNTLIVCCLFFLGTAELSAQKKGTKQRTSGTTSSSSSMKSSTGTIPNLYLGFGGGWNYQTGIFGLEVEVPFGEKISADVGLGLGLLRTKASVGANYYFSSVAKGLSVNAGVTYASKLAGFNEAYSGEINLAEFNQFLQDVFPNEEVKGLVDENGEPFVGEASIALNSAPTFDLGLSYNARLGTKSKFVITLGYALPLNETFEVTSSSAFFDAATKNRLNKISPGGFMMGYKFIFGIGG